MLGRLQRFESSVDPNEDEFLHNYQENLKVLQDLNKKFELWCKSPYPHNTTHATDHRRQYKCYGATIPLPCTTTTTAAAQSPHRHTTCHIHHIHHHKAGQPHNS